jgi:hypothetical protein
VQAGRPLKRQWGLALSAKERRKTAHKTSRKTLDGGRRLGQFRRDLTATPRCPAKGTAG